MFEDVRNAVNNVNLLVSNIKLEDIHFSEYEDSYDNFENEQESEKQTMTLSKQDE